MRSLTLSGWSYRDSEMPGSSGGVDTSEFMSFVRDTQGGDLETARRRYPSVSVGPAVLESLMATLAAPLPRGGTVGVFSSPVIRYGISAVASSGNSFTVRAGVPCGGSECDLVLYVNGLPVASMFLAAGLAEAESRVRAATGGFLGRSGSVLNFASDGRRVSVTASPCGERTVFMPFNADGEGEDPGDGAASFLWDELLTPDGVMEILERYAFEVPGKDGAGRPCLPRYHQLDAVRSVFGDVLERGYEGNSYLVQHSPGSGKSNTIAWLAARLAYEVDADGAWAFDRVLVISDRRVVDRQLAESVREHAARDRRDVSSPQDSSELTEALFGSRHAGKDKGREPRIVVSTVQKFPFVSAFGEMAGSGRRYAILIDEAHSSQSGSNAYALADRLSDEDDWDLPDDIDQEALDAIKRLGPKPKNLTFVAFTATPRKETLVQFGVRCDGDGEGDDGDFRPFHLYSLRQAIREGYVLDVLDDYVPYWLLYRLAETGRGVVEGITEKRLASLLRAKASRDPATMRYKCSIMLEHFVSKTRPECGGNGKAMIVAESRAAVVEYLHIVRSLVDETPEAYGGIRAMVAFSGSLDDPETGTDTTEALLNGFPDAQTKREFRLRGDILIVCDKFQVGFDENLLCGMYVDKSLDGLKIVQTLSRLNRIHPDWEKRTHIIDFRNAPKKIRGEFEKYYDVAEVDFDGEESVENLEEVMGTARAWSVYSEDDAESLWAASQAKPVNYEAIESAMSGPMSRFAGLDEDGRLAFVTEARNATRSYGLARLLFSIPEIGTHRDALFLSEALRRVSAGRVRNYFDIEAEVEAVMAERMRASNAGPAEFKDQVTTRKSGTRETRDDSADADAAVNAINEEDGHGLMGSNASERDAFYALRHQMSVPPYAGMDIDAFVSEPSIRALAAAYYEAIGDGRGYTMEGGYGEYDGTAGLATSFESYFLANPEARDDIVTAFLEAMHPASAGRTATTDGLERERRSRLRAAPREGVLIGVVVSGPEPAFVRRSRGGLYVVDAEGYRIAEMTESELVAAAACGDLVRSRSAEAGGEKT